MKIFRGLLVLAIFSACSASHSFKIEHSIAHALQFAERVIDEDLKENEPEPLVQPYIKS